MKINSLKKSFLNSSFYKVAHTIKKDPLNYIYTIILDLIFLALILFIGKYTGSLIPQNPEQLMALFKTQTALLLFAIVYPLAYYLVIIFIYSAIKLTILNLIRSIHEKSSFSFKNFWKLYWMNVLIFLIFLLAGLVLLGASALILTQSFLKYFILILAIPFFFFLYSIINISSTIFIKSNTKGIIKKSFALGLMLLSDTLIFILFVVFFIPILVYYYFTAGSIMLSVSKFIDKLKEHCTFFVWNICFILIYLIVYNMIHLFFRKIIFSNDALLSAYGGAYIATFNIISLIFFYIIIAFNRIYFYKRIDKNVL